MLVRARTIRRGLLGVAAAVLFATALTVAVAPGATGDLLAVRGPGAASTAGPGECLTEQESAFLQLINNYRHDNGLPALAVSRALNVASYLHSDDMARHNYFDHNGQDGSTPQDRMAQQGYDTTTATGENIAAGYPTAQEAFDTWRDSPGHNANMLDGDYTAIGIGLATDPSSDYGSYWTTDFGGVTDAPPACTG